jgi:hypothetical protein
MWLLGLEVGSFADVIISIGILVLLVCGAFCIGAGVYTLADFIEAHVVISGKVLRTTTYVRVRTREPLPNPHQVVIATLFLFWIIDRPPFMVGITGIAAHAAYWTLLQKFPVIPVKNWRMLLSIGMCSTTAYLILMLCASSACFAALFPAAVLH